MRVYLAGPINGRTDDEALSWRAEAIRLRTEIEWLNPMTRDYRGREDMHVADIVAGDLADIEQCDVVLVYAALGASWGAAMEIVYAKQMGKRIVVIVDDPDPHADIPISPWLRYHADALFASVAAAVESL